jgi:hypothetical protein
VFDTRNDVFDWLIEKTASPTFHLKLLHGKKGHLPEFAAIFRECAFLMTPYPQTTRSLLLQGLAGWRGHLVGNMIAILQNMPTFETDQALSLIGGSWVAPQLAAGIALTTQGQAMPLLEAFLELAIEDQHLLFPKSMLSAYATLKLVGSQKADEFEQTERFTQLQASDRDNCIERTYRYYESDLWEREAGIL